MSHQPTSQARSIVGVAFVCTRCIAVREAFRSTEAYYSVAAHEICGHWTGHPSRLAREFGKRFDDNAYAMEELVAETTSAVMSAKWGITVEPREDHVQYLRHWLGILKSDDRAIFTAASVAQTAADYCDRLQPAPSEADATSNVAAMQVSAP